MSQVCVFLAEGFEEIEGLTVVDLLRRANIDVKMVSITGQLQILGAHQIPIITDVLFEEVSFDKVDMIVLPGGMPGTLNLGKHQGVLAAIDNFNTKKKQIAAICAAPSILGDMGILKGKRATCYPEHVEHLKGAMVSTNSVESDEHITTSRGLGTAIAFSLELIAKLIDRETADRIKKAIIYGHNV